MTSKIVVCDTSVLINFLKIDRVDLLEKYSHGLLITDHVQEEIATQYIEQRSRFENGLNRGIFEVIKVDDSKEFEIFAKLSQTKQLGSGECASIAVACNRQFKLAIDDNRAIKKAETFLSSSMILRTQDLIANMIKEQVISLSEADQLIEVWAVNHRFKLKIQSFSELLEVHI